MTAGQAETIRLHDKDNVAIALRDLAKGEVPAHVRVLLASEIKRGHKIAIATIAAGQNVVRYGQTIGRAKADIAIGDHVHIHNMGMTKHMPDYAIGSCNTPLAAISEALSFEGYHRADGRVGTRNYLGIVATVNCSATAARFIAQAAERPGFLDEFENIDGVVPIVHGSGCGMADRTEGFDTLRRTLAGYAKHPNFGGVLLVGLGCEVMQLGNLLGPAKMRADDNFRHLTIQRTGGDPASG